MKILVLILGNLIILSVGILMRFLYKKYVLKEENITFRKLFSKKQKNTIWMILKMKFLIEYLVGYLWFWWLYCYGFFLLTK